MKNFILQQMIFVCILTLLATGACKNDKEAKEQKSTTEWQQKSSEKKWDQNASYQVTLPCEDCSGIIVKLQLKEDGTYRLIKNYNDNNKEAGEIKMETGNYHWNEDGTILKLANDSFKVSENILKWINPTVKRIKKDDKSNEYTLRQISKDSINS
ncbi:copper resistance protein NlpE N-terminal domain-containing protein [Zunongwangia sp.]|uniref:copper resistance protein NlpE N-terminal domain-containing protein n=1 Tax=Zunongwangia sp. TaxID=1965325 RepID=UPI003AA7B3FE